ncbi:hypothetical protein F8O06_10455 [Pseudoclavibacter sp. CFCC 14310]|uniref:hypothetical protein n=1 Tax=Pseudoclavibacter sp. CFCC 14310 TaxID=2615180 RepID=UPI0013011BD1|nr:hypothetical protein [Pseudoclavibacter sp. CFCC 14310]KAB1644450.1 hypothetical protein F8O06_10455 [Pseudoclavibacter sp. CFCC 14310]
MSRQHAQSVSFDELVGDAEDAPTRERRSIGSRWASFFSGLLLTLAVLASPLAMGGWWLEHDLLDTDAFVAQNADLINDSNVRDAIVTKATNTIKARVTLPAGAQAVIGDAVQKDLRAGIDAALAPDTMQQTWRALLSASHQQNVAALRGETTPTDDSFTLQLGPLVDQARTQLATINAPLAAMLPDADITMSIGPTGSIDKAKPVVAIADQYATPLIAGVVIALVAGVALAAGGRMRALSRVATWLVVACAATFALARAGAWLMANLLQRQLGDAAQPLFTSVTMPLQTLATVIGVVFLVIALVSRTIFVIARRRRA